MSKTYRLSARHSIRRLINCRYYLYIPNKTFFFFRSKSNADQLFPSDDDSASERAVPVVKAKPEKNKRKSSHKSTECQPSTSKKSKPATKPTASDLFGSDSEDENLEATGKKIQPIYSYITRRLANGFSRQIDEKKSGSYYTELKIYKCDDIERVAPVNRWRHSIMTIKNKCDTESESWKHLNEYVKSVRKEFNDCPRTFISSYQ